MESELKEYRVFVRRSSVDYGHVDVEATDREDAIQKAYDYLEDDDPDDTEPGDCDSWEVENPDHDVELRSERGCGMPISQRTNFTTGYVGQELMLL